MGENLNGNLRLGSLMEKSKDIIRRTFTFKSKYYKAAAKVLHNAENSLNTKHNSNRLECLSKVGKDTRNYKNIQVTGGKNLSNFYIKKKDVTNENTIFVGIHVRYSNISIIEFS